jgi:hypothetical protein
MTKLIVASFAASNLHAGTKSFLKKVGLKISEGKVTYVFIVSLE